MRARYSSVAATGEASPLAKAAVSSWIVRTPLLLDDSRHAEELATALGRVGQGLALRQARAVDVVAHDVDQGHGVRRGLHARGIQGAELVDVGEDAAELLAHPLQLRVVERQAGEAGDVLDVLPRDHARSPPAARTAATAACGRRRRIPP